MLNHNIILLSLNTSTQFRSVSFLTMAENAAPPPPPPPQGPPRAADDFLLDTSDLSSDEDDEPTTIAKIQIANRARDQKINDNSVLFAAMHKRMIDAEAKAERALKQSERAQKQSRLTAERMDDMCDRQKSLEDANQATNIAIKCGWKAFERTWEHDDKDAGKRSLKKTARKKENLKRHRTEE